MPLNLQHTQAYMAGFFGFGNPTARWCFVGLEEGGGNHYDQVEARINSWVDRNQSPLEDLPEYSAAVGHGLELWFGDNAVLQSTWNKLIHLLLTAQGQLTDTVHRRLYQNKNWGRQNSQTILTDIYPLPSPSRDHWYYDQWVGGAIPALASREVYHESIEQTRLLPLRNLILSGKCKPRIVVIYALAWNKIRRKLLGKLIGVGLPEIVPPEDGIWMNKVGQHLVAIVYQPTRYRTLAYFAKMGLMIRARANEIGIPLI